MNKVLVKENLKSKLNSFKDKLNNENFQNKVQKIKGDIKGVGKNVGANLGRNIKSIGKNLGSNVKVIKSNVGNNVKNAGGRLKVLFLKGMGLLKQIFSDKTTVINLAYALISVLICAGLSALFLKTDSAWYLTLKKPADFMPKLVFPVMWILVYICLFITLFVLLRKGITKKQIALFSANGALQILWCAIFFTVKSVSGGMVIIICTLIASFMLWYEVYKNSKKLSVISALYPLWMCLATVFNLATFILN